MSNKFCIIDGTAQIYRSYYAVKGLSTSKGFPTNAIYGFVNILNKILKDIKPDYICVVFDSPKPNFRHILYKEYKATRTKPAEDMILQIAKIKEIVSALGIKILEIDGFEADDIIATIVEKLSGKCNFIIVSSDKDIMQLVNDNVKLFDVKTNEYIDKNKVVERLGIEPQLITSYLAILGDNVDNIKGIQGIGPKRVIEILKENLPLEKLIEKPEKIPQQFRQTILDNVDLLKNNLELVTLKTIEDFDYNLTDFIQKEHDNTALTEIYTELEFKRFLEAVPKTNQLQLHISNITKSKLSSIKETSFKEIIAISNSSSDISIILSSSHDTTKLLQKHQPQIIISCNNSYSKTTLNETTIKTIVKLLETKTTYTYNIKEIFKALNYFPLKNIEVKDIYIIDNLLDPGIPKQPERLFAAYTDNMKHFSDELIINFCFNLNNIVKVMEEKLTDKQKSLYTKLEIPLSSVLANMERRGILINKEKLNKLSITFNEELNYTAKEIFKIADSEFNIDSPKQLQTVLYDKLKIKPGKKTKTGYSTDQEELIRISNIHPIGSKLLKYRTIAKLLNTYIEAFPKYLDSDGRIHTTFIQGGTITGRLSSQDPNLQNIPIRTEEGKKIRDVFIASKGYKLLSLDYSQIELRILAHLSEEEKLIEAFNQNKDIHTETACTLFHKKPEEVTDNMRRFAKSINFGIIYGMGPHGLSEQLGISHAESREFIESFFKLYPNVKKYIERELDKAKSKGYVENMFERIRYIDGMKSANFHEKSAAERIAINTPIQGTAADITKFGMINLFRYFIENNVDAYILLQIHDEILIEYNEQYDNEFINKCKYLMTNIDKLNLKVSLSVNIATGKSWGDL